MQQLFNSTATKVGDVLIDYSKQQGYTVVLDGGEQQQQGPFVLYTVPHQQGDRGCIQPEIGRARSSGTTGERRLHTPQPSRQE